MQSRKIRFSNNKKKKWPMIVTLIVGGILIIVPTIWIGLNNWNLDDSLSALSPEPPNEEPAQTIPEPPDNPEKLPDTENEEPVPPEEPEEKETPEKKPDDTTKNPTPPVEEPDNTSYIPNQTLPESPTIIDGFIIANKKNPLPSDYNKGEDKTAREAFDKMAAAAKIDGYELFAFSTFRSYERQVNLYNQYVEKDGQAAADRYSARPGYSEHQTGLAFDIGEVNFEQHWASASFGETPAGKWVAQNAHLYGFILRYPLGKEEITGYMHEAWHFRYVGVVTATDIYKNKITLEEYLGI